MNVPRAYTNAGSLSGSTFTRISSGIGSVPQRTTQTKDSGDILHFSSEALELLENGGAANHYLCAQDATYDHTGNITRQVEALNRDLNNLARSSYAAGAGLAGKINLMRAQAGSFRASV